MQLGKPDRVPLMCQLSIGHYFMETDLDPVEIWCTSSVFAEALVSLQRHYHFDGILVNLPGRDPEWKSYVKEMEHGPEGTLIEWTNGKKTQIPVDDNPQYLSREGDIPLFESVDPGELFYVEPWGLAGVSHQGGDEFNPSHSRKFPPYQLDALEEALKLVDGEVSVHGEIFSPWSQFLEFFGYENGLLATMDNPERVEACLERLAEGSAVLGKLQASLDIDAVLISSAFAGSSFISREHYQRFVLPYERKVIEEIGEVSEIPVYTHTCGKIGDRLDLMLETGTRGIDTLDPPPLGTVELGKAKKLLDGKAFIKGNIDPVNILLKGSVEEVRKDAQERIRIAKPGGGYILSSACSVAPRTPPENIEILYEVVQEEGRY